MTNPDQPLIVLLVSPVVPEECLYFRCWDASTSSWLHPCCLTTIVTTILVTFLLLSIVTTILAAYASLVACLTIVVGDIPVVVRVGPIS